MRLPSERFDYSAITQRPVWSLPQGAKLAVYPVVNVEDWDFEKAVPRQYVAAPSGASVVPDVQNWAWHEYGMRVGFWRVLEALEKRKLRASAPVNARLCRTYRPVAQAMLDAGWEFLGHGVTQGPMHAVPDQAASIAQSYALLKEFTGKAPLGWLGPGMHETDETLDLLAATGFQYVCDWAMDEQPVRMRVTQGSMVAMPYSLEMADLPMMVVHHHESRVWLERVREHATRLLQDGAHTARVMPLSVHPYIMGVPHRIAYFEAALDFLREQPGVWITTAAEIYDWYSRAD